MVSRRDLGGYLEWSKSRRITNRIWVQLKPDKSGPAGEICSWTEPRLYNPHVIYVCSDTSLCVSYKGGQSLMVPPLWSCMLLRGACDCRNLSNIDAEMRGEGPIRPESERAGYVQSSNSILDLNLFYLNPATEC